MKRTLFQSTKPHSRILEYSEFETGKKAQSSGKVHYTEMTAPLKRQIQKFPSGYDSGTQQPQYKPDSS